MKLCPRCSAFVGDKKRSLSVHIARMHPEINAQQRLEKQSRPEFTLRCLECDQLIANSNNVLARHVRCHHQLDWSDYEVKHHFGGTWPTCSCGCGERVPWTKGGFGDHIAGHIDHQGRSGPSNGMYGKKGEDCPNFGKKRTAEMKERYVAAAKLTWQRRKAAKLAAADE